MSILASFSTPLAEPYLDVNNSDDTEALRDPATTVAEVAVDVSETVRVMCTLEGRPPVGNRRRDASRPTSASLVHLCSCKMHSAI